MGTGRNWGPVCGLADLPATCFTAHTDHGACRASLQQACSLGQAPVSRGSSRLLEASSDHTHQFVCFIALCRGYFNPDVFKTGVKTEEQYKEVLQPSIFWSICLLILFLNICHVRIGWSYGALKPSLFCGTFLLHNCRRVITVGK